MCFSFPISTGNFVFLTLIFFLVAFPSVEKLKYSTGPESGYTYPTSEHPQINICDIIMIYAQKVIFFFVCVIMKMVLVLFFWYSFAPVIAAELLVIAMFLGVYFTEVNIAVFII